jgi:hypothetical protein
MKDLTKILAACVFCLTLLWFFAVGETEKIFKQPVPVDHSLCRAVLLHNIYVYNYSLPVELYQPIATVLIFNTNNIDSVCQRIEHTYPSAQGIVIGSNRTFVTVVKFK